MSADPDLSNPGGALRLRIALVTLFCLLPVFAIGGGLALAPLVTLAGLASLSPKLIKHVGLALFACLALVGWTAIASFWGPSHNVSLVGKLLTMVATGFALAFAANDLPARDRRWVRASILGSALVLASLCAVEALFDMPFNRAAQPDQLASLLIRNPGRGVFILDTMAFSAIAAALSLSNAVLRTTLVGILVLAIGVLSLQFDMTANAASFALGGGFFLLTLRAPRFGLALMGAIAGLWMLAAPWAMLLMRVPMEDLIQSAPNSWGMRVEVWTYAADKITERPWLGWGFDSSRTFDEVRAYRNFTYDAIPLHPHSMSLQVWLETGAVGAILATIAILAITRAAVHSLRAHNSAAAAAAASAAVIWLGWNLSYGAWQEWYIALTFIAAAAALALRRSGDAAA